MERDPVKVNLENLQLEGGVAVSGISTAIKSGLFWPLRKARTIKAAFDALGRQDSLLHQYNRSIGGRNLIRMEGYMLPGQAYWMNRLISLNPGVTRIAETGFNAGHSAHVFLSTDPKIRVLSFDINEHEYVSRQKAMIDKMYEGRHELKIGDSRITVPQFKAENPGQIFDLFFIDGGHDYDVAQKDLSNFATISRPGSIVVMDDYSQDVTYGRGPTKAWNEAVRDGMVVFEGVCSAEGRTWAYGRF